MPGPSAMLYWGTTQAPCTGRWPIRAIATGRCTGPSSKAKKPSPDFPSSRSARLARCRMRAICRKRKRMTIEIEQLARDIAILKDRLAIEDCIHRHARGHDRFDVELM